MQPKKVNEDYKFNATDSLAACSRNQAQMDEMNIQINLPSITAQW